MVRKYVAFDETDEAFDRFLSDFQGETDRAAAVLGAAFIDDLLEALLCAIAVDEDVMRGDLLGMSHPLSTLSARIDAAFCFALVTQAERRDMHFVRKIRNAFAHLATPLSFDDAPVRDWCREFGCNRERFQALPAFAEEYSQQPRKLFDLAVALLAHGLVRRLRSTRRVEEAQPLPMAGRASEERS